MNSGIMYYRWFQKVISIFIDIFFVLAPLVTLYVFTNPFTGTIKYVIFGVLLLVYGSVIYFFKDKIKTIIEKILNRLSDLDERKMLIIIVLVMLALKVIYSLLFSYDGSTEGDIEIYNEIADHIIETGELHSRAISHLYGVALHFVVFRLFHLPVHIGMFLVILTGTIFNFLSFKKILGKEKAFLAILVYALMPSTSMMSFCATHEVFVYMYVSVFLFFFNLMLYEEKTSKSILYLFFGVISTALTCLVNPGGYIIYIIMGLCILLSNVSLNKKTFVVCALVLSIISNSLISRALGINEYNTKMNTFTILIHGANPESLGEQVDGYPLKEMRMYIHNNTLDFSKEGFVDAGIHVLMGQYKYLLTHPMNLIRLIMHKFYILWSGVHYPLEYAHHFNAYSNLIFYGLLVINTLIYLFMITIGLVYRKKNDDDTIDISNYKLEFLGVIALTMLCIVVNKYSLYATAFIYLISFYRSSLNERKL